MTLTAEMQKIMSLARRSNASDIHIVAGLPPLFRVSGDIVVAEAPALSREDTKRLTMDLLNEEQRKAFEANWQLCCSLYDGKLGRFRVSAYYHGGNPEMAIRAVNYSIPTRAQLGLPEQTEDMTRLNSGLVLITGPTGSGKTTTMNYMIDLINSERRCKIITIEDPVEYVHSQKRSVIVQQELYSDVKSFGSALIHVLRQDPDVVCIGEMRDHDTTETALMAAETGHLVIATCHTPSAVQTVERIVALFPGDQQPQIVTQLANSLQCVIAQRLLGRADKKGQVLATELMIANAAVRNHLREKEFHLLINVLQTGKRTGQHTMDDSILELYQQGSITYETALTNATDITAMKSKLRGGNGSGLQ
jgi:twitching motility protein PilT